MVNIVCIMLHMLLLPMCMLLLHCELEEERDQNLLLILYVSYHIIIVCVGEREGQWPGPITIVSAASVHIVTCYCAVLEEKKDQDLSCHACCVWWHSGAVSIPHYHLVAKAQRQPHHRVEID